MSFSLSLVIHLFLNNRDVYNVYCSIFHKYSSNTHQGEEDLRRHCDGSVHANACSATQIWELSNTSMNKKDFDNDNMALLAEIILAGIYFI